MLLRLRRSLLRPRRLHTINRAVWPVWHLLLLLLLLLLLMLLLALLLLLLLLLHKLLLVPAHGMLLLEAQQEMGSLHVLGVGGRDTLFLHLLQFL